MKIENVFDAGKAYAILFDDGTCHSQRKYPLTTTCSPMTLTENLICMFCEKLVEKGS